jgi:hypothetical protein
MQPQAKTENLLYVSNGGPEDLLVFSYPNGKLVGHLKGFGRPGALCVDPAQDVWIGSQTPSDAFRFTEYGHGGTSPIRVVVDSDYGIDCAVDPTTGNLTAINFSGAESSEPGNVTVYNSSAAGLPRMYQDSSLMFYQSGVYDNEGNLFVVGDDQDYTPMLGELPHGETKFVNFSIKKYVSNVTDGVLWDGSNVVVSEQVGGSEAILYRFSVSGSSITPKGKVQLGDEFDTRLFIAGARVIGGDLENSVLYWDYPKGYGSTKISKDVSEPVAVAVSLVP